MKKTEKDAKGKDAKGKDLKDKKPLLDKKGKPIVEPEPEEEQLSPEKESKCLF